jgi:hypothetical protein
MPPAAPGISRAPLLYPEGAVMAYIRKPAPDGPLISAEQARRRNAEMRIELVALMAEQAQLEAKASAMRGALTDGYRKLSRQIKELDAVRAQADQIAAHAQHASTLPPPKYGGREGLQAATDEILAHESRGLKLAKTPSAPKAARGPSHGTDGKYKAGCRCGECVTRKALDDTRRRKRAA